MPSLAQTATRSLKAIARAGWSATKTRESASSTASGATSSGSSDMLRDGDIETTSRLKEYPMVDLASLWLPILLSAVLVFVVSSIIHMVVGWHKADHKKLAKETEALEAMRKLGVSPGSYMFPCPASMKDMSSPEMLEKYNAGPVGFMTVFPNGPPAMGKSLVLWFIYSIVISIFVGYIATMSLSRGADYNLVFRVTGTVAILGYAVPNVVDTIWKGVSWGVTFRFIVDGILYGLCTAGAFGWLWPAA